MGVGGNHRKLVVPNWGHLGLRKVNQAGETEYNFWRMLAFLLYFLNLRIAALPSATPFVADQGKGRTKMTTTFPKECISLAISLLRLLAHIQQHAHTRQHHEQA
jgi:hypothetical protein